MSPIASLLHGRGHIISGSDRSYDQGQSPEKFEALKSKGFNLFPQDGSGISADIDFVVASAAVEDKIPDVRIARNRGISILGKADILAQFLNNGNSIGIAGTSGKTTVTGMTGFILHECGVDVGMMCGGHIVNLLEQGQSTGNAYIGQDAFVAETDESDGSVNNYSPYITVLNNITLDHKPMAELRRMFSDMLTRTRHKGIINIDDPEAAILARNFPAVTTVSTNDKSADFFADNLKKAVDHIAFDVHCGDQQVRVNLKMPGVHNVSNALCALAACVTLDVNLTEAAKALSGFKGIKRRFEVVGNENNITVIDDFGHNPDKIAATLRTLKDFDGRVLVMFQPHGFGPTKMLKTGLIETFVSWLHEDDILLMPEIYYAGGTAEKSISSKEITDNVNANGKCAVFFDTRDQIKDYIKEVVQPFDRIVIMGARDDTLSTFARSVLDDLKQSDD